MSSLLARDRLPAARRARLLKTRSSNASAVEHGMPKGPRFVRIMAWLPAVNVSIVVPAAEPVAIVEGLNEAVTPAGNPLAVKVTGYTNVEFTGATDRL